MYNSRTLNMEKTIHVRFNHNKPDTTTSELDESFVEMKIENFVKSTATSSQDKHVSNSPVDDQPKEVREPIGRILRKHHPVSQIISNPKDKV